MIVRAATDGDLAAVAALLRGSFAPELAPYMTYAQPGIGAFLAPFLTAPDRRLLVAEEGGKVIAFAEFRLAEPDASFLSYVCVAPAARGRGVATSLMRTFLAQEPAVATMGLDVFAHNSTAIGLYEKIGFRATGETAWVTRPLPAPAAAPALAGADDVAAAARFARFGFCELSIRWRGAARRLGRIGPATLRCFGGEDFGDDDLLTAVRAAFPGLTEALWIGPEAQIDPRVRDARIINRAIRMASNLNGLRA